MTIQEPATLSAPGCLRGVDAKNLASPHTHVVAVKVKEVEIKLKPYDITPTTMYSSFSLLFFVFSLTFLKTHDDDDDTNVLLASVH